MEEGEDWLNDLGLVKKPFLTDEEVDTINPDIHNAILQYINDYVLSVEESCDSDEEHSAVEHFFDTLQIPESYRVYPDGTFSVQILINSPSITYTDEDGDDRTVDPLKRVNGAIVANFDDQAKSGDNAFIFDSPLEDQVISLFK